MEHWSAGAASRKQGEPEEPTTEVVWERFEESRGWPVLRDGSETHHELRTTLARLRVSPGAVDAYRQLGRGVQLPVGSGILLETSTPDGAPLYFAMSKASGGWEFLKLGPQGTTLQRDSAGFCARCHAEGVSDSLFGFPWQTSKDSTPGHKPTTAP